MSAPAHRPRDLESDAADASMSVPDRPRRPPHPRRDLRAHRETVVPSQDCAPPKHTSTLALIAWRLVAMVLRAERPATREEQEVLGLHSRADEPDELLESIRPHLGPRCHPASEWKTIVIDVPGGSAPRRFRPVRQKRVLASRREPARGHGNALRRSRRPSARPPGASRCATSPSSSAPGSFAVASIPPTPPSKRSSYNLRMSVERAPELRGDDSCSAFCYARRRRPRRGRGVSCCASREQRPDSVDAHQRARRRLLRAGPARGQATIPTPSNKKA